MFVEKLWKLAAVSISLNSLERSRIHTVFHRYFQSVTALKQPR